VLDNLFAKAMVLDDGQTKACPRRVRPRHAPTQHRSRSAQIDRRTHRHPRNERDALRDALATPAPALVAQLRFGRRYWRDQFPLPEIHGRLAGGFSPKQSLTRNAKLSPTRVSFAREKETRLAFNRRY